MRQITLAKLSDSIPAYSASFENKECLPAHEDDITTNPKKKKKKKNKSKKKKRKKRKKKKKESCSYDSRSASQ